jgi:hypothetical protein
MNESFGNRFSPIMGGESQKRPGNGYLLDAGMELDCLIHEHVMKRRLSSETPAYSTERRWADDVRSRIKSTGGKLFVGQLAGNENMWFARHESVQSGSTEVLGSTYPLAICRLAAVLHRDWGIF